MQEKININIDEENELTDRKHGRPIKKRFTKEGQHWPTMYKKCLSLIILKMQIIKRSPFSAIKLAKN